MLIEKEISNRNLKRERKQTLFYKSGDTVSFKPNNSKQSDFLYFTYDEPRTLQEALKSKLKDKWSDAIKSEFLSLKENNTWTLSELPEVKKAIKTRWVFKIKHDSNNQPERFKARLVAKGYNQEY